LLRHRERHMLLSVAPGTTRLTARPLHSLVRLGHGESRLFIEVELHSLYAHGLH